MKIVCDECGAKYAIADDKVRGKVFKIRCKKCSNVIVVRGTAGEEEQSSQPEQNETRTFDYAGYDNPQEDAAVGDEAVWHLVIDQEQVGPLSVAEVQQRFAQGLIDRETYAWREGFDDWVPVGSLSEFANLGAGDAEGDAAAGMFAGAAAGAAEADQGSAGDPFATQVAQTGGDAGGDLFSGAAASSGGGGSLFDGADDASANDKRLRGERNENSVLFSLGNLAALASESKPAPAAASNRGQGGGMAAAGMAQAGGSEGSGLIDIRSLANLYTDDRSGGGAGAKSGASALGAIEPVSFAAQSSVLLPTAPVSNNNNKTLYIVLGVAGAMLVAAVVLILVVLKGGGQQPAVAAAPPAGQAEETTAPGGAAAAATPPAGDKGDGTAAAAGGGEAQAAAAQAGETGGDEDKGQTAVARNDDKGDDDDDKGSRRSSSRSGSSTTRSGSRDSKPSGGDSKPAGGDSKPAGGDSSGGGGKCMDEVGCLLADRPPPCCSKYSGGGGGGGGGSTRSGGGGSSNSNLPERLDRSHITQGINGVRGKVTGCGSKSPGKGQVKVSVKVEPSGSVGGVEVKSAPNSALGSCVAGAVKRARFAKTQKGGSFSYPFVF